ncbi:hypothetical protein [Nocardia sp. NPDC004711]
MTTADPHGVHQQARHLRAQLAALHDAHPGGECTHDPEYDCTPAVFAAQVRAAEVALTTYLRAHRTVLAQMDCWRGDYVELDATDPAPFLREALAGLPTPDKLTTAAAILASAAGYLGTVLPSRPHGTLTDPADAHVIAAHIATAEYSIANVIARLGDWSKALGKRSYDSKHYATADPDGTPDQILSQMGWVATRAESASTRAYSAATDTEAISRQLSWLRLG